MNYRCGDGPQLATLGITRYVLCDDDGESDYRTSHLRKLRWWCRASCPRMSVDILGTNCDQRRSMVQCCFTSTETRRLIRTLSPGRPPRLSHSSWTLENLETPKGELKLPVRATCTTAGVQRGSSVAWLNREQSGMETTRRYSADGRPPPGQRLYLCAWPKILLLTYWVRSPRTCI